MIQQLQINKSLYKNGQLHINTYLKLFGFEIINACTRVATSILLILTLVHILLLAALIFSGGYSIAKSCHIYCCFIDHIKSIDCYFYGSIEDLTIYNSSPPIQQTISYGELAFRWIHHRYAFSYLRHQPSIIWLPHPSST